MNDEKECEKGLYEVLEDGRIRCLTCRQRCLIKNGTTGQCAVRMNKDGKLVLLVYGRPTSLGMDPIEKKPLYHFLPGSDILSLGTVGCNFSCKFCQNWTTSQVSRSLKRQLKAADKPQQLLEAEIEDICGRCLSPNDVIQIALHRNTSSVAYTYNEPTIFVDYALDIMRRGVEMNMNLNHVFVTNGYESDETLTALKPYLSAANVDLKAFNNSFYTKLCGAKLEPVLENIQKFYDMGVVTEVTTLLIEGQNDNEDELKNLVQFLYHVSPDIPWHISAAHPAFEMTDIRRTSDRTLLKAARLGEAAGLKYIYCGNTRDNTFSNTKCPQCKKVLITRDYYRGVNVGMDLENGCCCGCGCTIYGRWN